jgi:cytochrome oxidase assembly protein ShyY1
LKLGKANSRNLIAAILLATLFVGLGFWQLGRANDMKFAKAAKPDSAPVAIETVTKPGLNLDGNSANRLVTLFGSYEKVYSAPNQKVKSGGNEERAELEVRLMKLNSDEGVLVVRGIENMSQQNIFGNVTVTGRLYPRQSSDVAKSEGSILSRLDPALVVGDTKLNLIDGYVVAIDEKTSLGEEILNQRISAERQLPKVAGFYWQHIAYVGIWWLFALLVLFAPFYDRIRDSKMRVG